MHNNEKLGLILMLLSALAYGAGDILVKVVGEGLSPWQMTVGRAFLGLLAALGWARFRLRDFLIPDWSWQVAIGVASSLGFISMMFTIKLLPLSVALPLIYLYPALGALMSPLINRESPSGSDWAAIIVALAGVIFLAHGTAADDSAASWAGLAWGFSSTFWMALMVNLTRRQAKARPTRVILFYLFAVNLLVSLPVVLMTDRPVVPAGADLGILLGLIAPSGVAAILFMSVGYRHINAHRGGVIMTFEAVAASLFGLIFLGEPLTIFVAAGSLMLIGSAVIIALGRPNRQTS